MTKKKIKKLQEEAANMDKCELIWSLIEAHDSRVDDEETEEFDILFDVIEDRMK